MDIRAYNSTAWDNEVAKGNEWTVPVDGETIARARRGHWHIILTPAKPVPADWFPRIIKDLDVLCLASAGGQQAPVLAAAGANVTVLDNSPRQLEQDKMVARREVLEIRTVEGDMADLSAFDEASFDLIVHPVSNTFAQEILPVWREAFRVLRRGGSLLAAFTNPACFLFDWGLAEETGTLLVKHKLPYSDVGNLPPEELQAILDQKLPVEHSHSLEEQIGGQIQAGFIITGFYEDGYPPGDEEPLNDFMPLFIATRALKP